MIKAYLKVEICYVVTAASMRTVQSRSVARAVIYLANLMLFPPAWINRIKHGNVPKVCFKIQELNYMKETRLLHIYFGDLYV